MHTTNDRQRARSLSSVPDLQASHNNHEAMSIPPNAVATQSVSHEDNASVNAIALGRFTATSLPSHIWSWNGKLKRKFLFYFFCSNYSHNSTNWIISKHTKINLLSTTTSEKMLNTNEITVCRQMNYQYICLCDDDRSVLLLP